MLAMFCIACEVDWIWMLLFYITEDFYFIVPSSMAEIVLELYDCFWNFFFCISSIIIYFGIKTKFNI